VTLFGIDGLTAGRAAPTRTYTYGPHAAQVADLYLPDHLPDRLPEPAAGRPRAVAVLVHGGYWRARYDRSLSALLVDDLLAHGWVVWNVDYRAVGEGPSDGGGWSRTHEDVAAAADLLVEVLQQNGSGDRSDPSAWAGPPVVLVGHSAGGALALWLAGRHRLPVGAPGARPRLRPHAVVAQAAVCDLVTGARDGLGDGAILDLMGGAAPADNPLAYAVANPTALLPLGVPTLVVTGDADDDVPHSQSLAFVDAARAAGDDVTLHVEPGADHFVHLRPETATWRLTRSWMSDVVHPADGPTAEGGSG
jgi:acetyl esterase/lipase